MSRAPATLPPTFLATFLGCRQAACWDLARRRGLDDARPDELTGQGELITGLGEAHEAAILSRLRAHAEVHVVEAAGDPSRREQAITDTRAAMDAGVPWIHQAALGGEVEGGGWFGYADFLRRTDEPCPSWPWSYEPWDAKLARHAAPKHVLQIALYAELVAAMQGAPSAHMGLMLGDGTRDGHAELRLRTEDFRWYLRRIAMRVERFGAALPRHDFTGDPCAACAQCGWGSRCATIWSAADHLSAVADITRAQRTKLAAAGIDTLAGLAALHPFDPEGAPRTGIAAQSLARLAQQAAVQLATRESADGSPPAVELLPVPHGLGFDRLPAPDAGDLWFDFEGDPLEPGGLEYLCGIVLRADALEGGRIDGADVEPVPDAPDLHFAMFWAHDAAAEKRAFVAFVDFARAHFERHPGAHLYHYAPYEVTALKRLAMLHAVREAEVDGMLRDGRFVDLYRVVRETMRVGAPSYSIKKLEPLYMEARATATADGGDSVVMYHRWRETGDDALLRDIADYNRDDCVSTRRLHEWLLARADGAAERGLRGTPEAAEDAAPEGDAKDGRPETDAERAKREKAKTRAAERREANEARAAELAGVEARLAETLGDEVDAPDRRGLRLARDLLRFHEREAKPEWWAFFERDGAAHEELVVDADALGACTADPTHWGEPVKRSLAYRYTFPEQETKLSAGSVHMRGEGGITVAAVDLDARTVTVTRGQALDAPPPLMSLMPGGPLDTSSISDAVRRVAIDRASNGERYPHIHALLELAPPRIAGRAPGEPVVAERATSPGELLDATVEAVLELESSWLVVQGPPGAGKTYTLARVIAALMRDGRTVGVSSNSHAAVDNVLRGVEAHWADTMGEHGHGPFTGYKKTSGTYDSPLADPMIVKAGRSTSDGQLYGGTAWYFTGNDAPEVDVLVVDEAGQVSLGHLVGMATAARNIVLVGDPMQLPQPTKGSHPNDSGRSCLEWAVGDVPVVSPERGVFLGTSWRMHPSLARFVSDAFYAGALDAEPGCANRRLVAPADGFGHEALKPHGLAFAELEHAACTQRSDEEAREIAALYAAALACTVVDRHGAERAMTPADILVVAPYNVQVRTLERALRDVSGGEVRVGTVDRFQGQEAEVVLVSMTTSDVESMPRDASFLLSPNRLNVAISRARCTAVIVASSGLLDLDARNVEEMRLANLLCRARADAEA